MTGPVDLIRVDRLTQVYDPWWVLNLEPGEITPDLEPQMEHLPYERRDLSYHLRRVRHFQLMAEQGCKLDPIVLDNVCDHGRVHPEVLRWIDEAPDAHQETPIIDEKHLTVDYRHAEEETQDLRLVAERLKASLNDHAVWSIGYTEGDGKPLTFVVYRAPAFLPLEVPPTFEGFNVVLQTASKPVMF